MERGMARTLGITRPCRKALSRRRRANVGNGLLTQPRYTQAVFKGIILALVLLTTGDLVLNQGKMTHAGWSKLSRFLSASSGAVQHSLWSW